MHQKILILDFGAQYTQLIARRVRECGVYCEIHPFDLTDAQVREFAPQGVILSGGPASVHESGTPRAPQAVFELGVPVLGICYGMQTMAAQLGGKVERGAVREFGYAEVRARGHSALLDRPHGLAGHAIEYEHPTLLGNDRNDVERPVILANRREHRRRRQVVPRLQLHRLAAGQGVGLSPGTRHHEVPITEETKTAGDQCVQPIPMRSENGCIQERFRRFHAQVVRRVKGVDDDRQLCRPTVQTDVDVAEGHRVSAHRSRESDGEQCAGDNNWPKHAAGRVILYWAMGEGDGGADAEHQERADPQQGGELDPPQRHDRPRRLVADRLGLVSQVQADEHVPEHARREKHEQRGEE